MEVHEQVVASIGPLPPEQTEGEKALANEVSVIEQRAMNIVIHSAEDFEQAGEFGRQLKQQSAMVKEFFAPMKDAAHQAHKQICEREKAMLAPLVAAEKTLKTAMGNYQLELERIRREKEEEIRRVAKAEADRKLAEASALEDKGDVAGAEAVLAGAAMLDQAGSVPGDDHSESGTFPKGCADQRCHGPVRRVRRGHRHCQKASGPGP